VVKPSADRFVTGAVCLPDHSYECKPYWQQSPGGNRFLAVKALVTGGAGFVGSNLVDALIERGLEVTVLDDLSTGREANLEHAVAGGARFINCDVADAVAVAELFAEVQPNLVFHLAAQAQVNDSVEDPARDAKVNVLGTISVLEGAVRAGTERLVYVSTGGAMYGESGIYPTPETAPIHPESPYGASKFAAESYVYMYGHLHDISTYTLRLANVYGPRQIPHAEGGVVAIFCERALAGQGAAINGDGEQTRDFVEVSDVVSALLAASESRESGACNIGTGLETSINQLVAAIGDLVDHDLEVSHAPARDGEVRRSVLDPTLAAQTFGWKAEVPLEQGLRRTLDHFR